MVNYNELFAEKSRLIQGLYSIPKVIDLEWIRAMFLDNKSSFFIWGWCYRNITNSQFLKNVTSSDLSKISFDDETSFPPELPIGFNPSNLLNATKKVPLGVDQLHDKGINGAGMSVAIIDSAFVPHIETEHSEFEYFVNSSIASEHFHGLITSTILAGKYLGIAPKARCNFFTISQMTAERDDELINGLSKIYDKINNGENICVVSLSMPYPKTTKDEYYEMVNKLDEIGCVVIDSVEFNKEFICARFTSTDLSDLESVDLNDWQREGEWLQLAEARIAIPSAGRALPLWGTRDRYHFCGQSGVSWSIPIIAGLYCLARQINADIKYAEFIQLIKQTAYTNKSELKIINVEKLFEVMQ